MQGKIDKVQAKMEAQVAILDLSLKKLESKGNRGVVGSFTSIDTKEVVNPHQEYVQVHLEKSEAT